MKIKKTALTFLAAAALAALPGAAMPQETEPTIPEFSELRTEREAVLDREAEFRRIIRENIDGGLRHPMVEKHEGDWRGAFWAAQLVRYRHVHIFGTVEAVLRHWDKNGDPLRRQALETAHALYPVEMTFPIASVLPRIEDPKLFAMAVNYLVNSSADDTPPETFLTLMNDRFDDAESDPILVSLAEELRNPPKEAVKDRPPLEELFAAPGFEGRPVVFSFHRVDRTQPGLALVRGADGRFVRDDKGALFNIPHLALAAGNYPGYLTNGNTPEGIHSLQGLGTSSNVFIGPTPYLHSTVPTEIPTAQWYHEPSEDESKEFPLDRYRGMLPPSWTDYRPFQEAWYAGQAGRTWMITHGTTIDPEFTANMPYYPNTPSLGCLTAIELWSPEDGRAIRSDQLELLNAVEKAGGADEGWVVVVELNAAEKPVTLLDVAPAVQRYEAGL